MLKAHFDQLAQYNRWANRRLYDDAASLSDEARKRPVGLFFGSVHGTLNHLLVTDQIWMRRMTGEGPQPERLNQILHEDFSALRAAREQEDDRIHSFVTGLAEADYDRLLEYQNSTGKTFQLASTYNGTAIPIGAYCQIGDEQIGQEIVRSIGDSPAILIKSHGVFTIGKNAEAAVKAAVMTEDVARTVHIALLRGQAEPLPEDEVARLHRVYLNNYGQRSDP